MEEKKEPLRVVVDRTRWLRGEGSMDSYLLRRRDWKMCCFGFAALAAGHETKDITNVFNPASLWGCKIPGCEEMCKKISSALPEAVHSAIVNNDDADMTDGEREAALIPLFRELGMELSFIDGDRLATPATDGRPEPTLCVQPLPFPPARNDARDRPAAWLVKWRDR